MDDIVAKLRRQDQGTQGHKPYPEFVSPGDAADEIERLREIIAGLFFNWPTTDAAAMVNETALRSFLMKDEALKRAAEVLNTNH